MKFPGLLIGILLFFGQVQGVDLQNEVFDGDSIVNGKPFPNVISANPEIFLDRLPDEIDENSGLIFWRDKLWTHNDSGGKPEIYAVDTASGNIVQTIYLIHAKNSDWEDIAQDDSFIYIGDFGNNRGTRTDLKIYKISKGDIPESGDAHLSEYETINFSYGDQVIGEKAMNQHNFDCEAMISAFDSLFLFTKNWADQQTRVYVLPKSEGNYTVFPTAMFDVGGLVTGADISDDAKKIALIGYVDFESFMWIFQDFDGTDFFNGRKMKVNFPDLVFVQTEGICFVSDTRLLISCEESAEFPMVFEEDLHRLEKLAGNGLVDYASGNIQISGMPPEVTNKLKVDIIKLPEPDFTFELRNKRWVKLFEGAGVMKASQDKVRISIRTNDLENGLYFLRIVSGSHSLVRKVRIVH